MQLIRIIFTISNITFFDARKISNLFKIGSQKTDRCNSLQREKLTPKILILKLMEWWYNQAVLSHFIDLSNMHTL